MQQRTDEWFAVRCGKVTASRISDVVAKTKSGPSASRKNYMGQLIAERLTMTPADSFTSAAMQWGTDTEPHARAAYEFYTGAEVAEDGFVEHPEIANTGASPDGIVGDDGLVEIKCPNTSTHIDTLLGSSIQKKYLLQMQWQMACTGRAWCDFVSFDPRMPEDMRIYIQRVERDDELIAELESEVEKFIAEINDKVEKLKDIYSKHKPA